MAQSGSNKKVANSLVAVSCGAVLAVYTAGYVRTRSAVDQFEAQAAERRAADPRPQRIDSPILKFRPEVPDAPAPAPPETASVLPNPERDTPGKPGQIVSAETEPAHIPAAIAALPTPPAETLAPPPPVTAPLGAHVVNPAPDPIAPAVEHKIEVTAPPDKIAPPAPMWKDGTYLGWGTSRHGNIQAEVVVESGRIASATIAQCRTRYSCNVIEKLPPEVAQRQSPNVDYVSGATQSANAFYFAVVDALSRAK
jgi:uncharacterized protein with FMN-binding domain